MKLVYVANVRIPTEKAHGIQIMKMCEAFSGMGNEVELWVPKRQTKIKDDPYHFYGVEKIFKIKKLWCLDVVHWGRLGYRVELLTFLISCLVVALFDKRIFYTREESVAATFSLLGKKVFWEDHRGNINLFVRMIIAMKVPIVSISKGLKDFYVELGVSPHNLLVAPDAVDLAQFEIKTTKEDSRKKLGLPLDKKIVMYVGLFEDWKGYKTVLESSKIISDDSVQFVMIGEGGSLEELRAMYPKVIFTGYKPYKELPANQVAADILLIPNSGRERISSHFTSPIKLFAHMASGRPLIVSDLPSMREVLDNTNATFFTPDSPESLSNAIIKVLNNPEEAAPIAERALEKVKEYSWEKRAEKILDYIHVKKDTAINLEILKDDKPLRVLVVTSTTDPNSGGWGKYTSDLVSSLESNGVDVVTHVIDSPLRFKRHFFLGWVEAIRMRERYKKNDFDIVHGVVEPYAFLVYIFSKLSKTKYVITAHGSYSISFLANPVYRWFQRLAYKNASKIVAVSSYTKRRLTQYVKLDNLVVIPNGLNYSEKIFVKEEKDHKVILSVGAIKERKGYHHVIEALARIKKDLGDFKYYIAGGKHDDAYFERLLKLTQSLGLESNVIFAGPVSLERKEQLYKEADIFVLTPISEGLHFEGFGLVYLEASAFGVPVIGSLESGAGDAIKDGETGILVPQNDLNNLADAILKILKDKSLAERMSVSGIQWARDHHWNNIVLQYMKIYKQENE